MKVATAILCCCCLLADLELLQAITVKPGNSQQPPPPAAPATIVENSHGEHKKAKMSPQDEDRVARYIPFTDGRQQQLDNLNLVRYLQSLPKSNPQIPSIAYLYGAAIKQTPLIQAGFIYKARPHNIYESVKSKDSYQSATIHPIFNRHPPLPPPPPSSPKYQHLYNQKLVIAPKAKHYTPFSPSNKISGAWKPVIHLNLHKPSHYDKGHVLSLENEYASPISLTNNDGSSEEFIPITNHPLKQQHVLATTPSTAFTKHYLKSDAKSITILNPEHSAALAAAHLNYEHQRYAAKATTTSPKPIDITSDHPSSRPPIDSYEFEEQIVYEVQPHAGNKSTSISDEGYGDAQHSIHHLSHSHEEDLTSPTPAKPHPNFPRITPVPNDLTQTYGSSVGKNIKGHSDVEINDAEIDYYDKDSDNYYDDVIKDGSPTPNTGRPGIDFPNFHEIPETAFSCKEQRYKGFFGDPETRCQVWHYCDLNGGKSSFLCPNGTIFSQTALTCDWWFNVKCSNTAQLYVLNERLYKFILPFTPKFPQDFQGPLVDKYLALKFKEMEEALQKEEEKKKESSTEDMQLQQQREEQAKEERREEEEEEEVGEGGVEVRRVVPDKVVEVEDTTDNTIESASHTQLIQSTEPPTQATTALVYLRQEEQQQPPLESVVEIHNPGMTGHLQRLIGENLES